MHECGACSEELVRPVLRGLRPRRRLSQPDRPDDLRGRQRLVHLPDDEHEPDPLQRRVRRRNPIRQAAGEQLLDALARHRALGPDTSENGTANLSWTDIELPNPVFAGDTLWAESEILAIRESRSDPDVGIVSLRTRGINQRGETVIEFKRSFMAYRRDAPQAQAGFPEPGEDWRA
jgi:Acyl dehydratase